MRECQNTTSSIHCYGTFIISQDAQVINFFVLNTISTAYFFLAKLATTEAVNS